MIQSGPQSNSELGKRSANSALLFTPSPPDEDRNTATTLSETSETASIKALINDTTLKGRKALYQLLLREHECSNSTKAVLAREHWLTIDSDKFTDEHPALIHPGLFPQLRLLMISKIYIYFGLISQQSLDFIKLCLCVEEIVPDAFSAAYDVLLKQHPESKESFLQDIRNNIKNATTNFIKYNRIHSSDPKETLARLILKKLAEKNVKKSSTPTIEQLLPFLKDDHSDPQKAATSAVNALRVCEKDPEKLTLHEILLKFEGDDLDIRIKAAEAIAAAYPFLNKKDAQSIFKKLLMFLESDGWKRNEAAAKSIGALAPNLNQEDAQSTFKKLLPLLKRAGFRLPAFTIQAISALDQHLSQEDKKLFLSQLLQLLDHEENPVREAAHQAITIIYSHANEEQQNIILKRAGYRFKFRGLSDAILDFYSQHWMDTHSKIDFSSAPIIITMPMLDNLKAQNPRQAHSKLTATMI